MSASSRQEPALWIDYLWLLLLGMIWGSSFNFIKIVVEEIPPASMALGRVLLASIFLYVIVKMAKLPLPKGRTNWILMLMVALTGNVFPFILIAWGEQFIDSGAAAILMALTPLSVPALAHIFTQDEKLTLRKMIGLLIGFAGVVVLIGPENIMNMGQNLLAQLAVLAASFFYAVTTIFNRILSIRRDERAGNPPLSHRGASLGIMVLSTIILIPISFIYDDPMTLTPSWTTLIALVYLGIVPSAIGLLLLLKITQRRGATFFSTVNYLVPVMGVLGGVFFLGEVLKPDMLIGLATILFGIFIATHQQIFLKRG